MLIIRLQRVGKTKKPVYRLIISEKARDTKGTYLELLGTYNPHDKVNGLLPKTERIQYWISKGAQMSETVNNLLVKAGVVTGEKKRSVHLSKKRQTKIAETKKAEEDKKAAAKAAAEAKVAEEKAAAEAAKVAAEAEKAAAEAKAAEVVEAPVEAPMEAPAETPVESAPETPVEETPAA